MPVIEVAPKPVISKQDFREKIIGIKDKVSAMPGALHGDCFPLKHSFCNGMYLREMTAPAYTILVGKIHKDEHPTFLLSGDITVLSETGLKRLTGPAYFITKPGEMRVAYTHTEIVWVDVFKTPETDLAKIEKECVATTYEEFSKYEQERIDNFVEQLKIVECKNELS